MRGIVVVLVLFLASFVADSEAIAASSPEVPRVALGVDAKTSQRFVQLTDRRQVYPTADVNCDGNRLTLTLTRSGSVSGKTVATYAVPPKVSAAMLNAAECRLMVPGREIAIGRQQIRSAWSGQTQAQKH